ncbi:MAG TPA: DUF6515 family protein [Steroidobacteraceae bacterium]|nr:DUF6515 family protein [Steroidobacteraceae bacterium]
MLIAAAALGGAGGLAAQEMHGRGHERGRAPEHFDARFRHDHYYPDRGAFVAGVPGRPFIYERPGGRYYYSGGIWYAPRGPDFVVIGAPVGVFVPVLPPFYTTVWFGGVPYYYANDTYYVWSSAQSGYEVVDPPGDAQMASTEAPQPPPPQGDDLYIYPRSGQSAEQQATDKYECHKWASSQTGFDPTQAGGGVAPEQLGARRSDYQRAMRACLQGRGYSAR